MEGKEKEVPEEEPQLENKIKHKLPPINGFSPKNVSDADPKQFEKDQAHFLASLDAKPITFYPQMRLYSVTVDRDHEVHNKRLVSLLNVHSFSVPLLISLNLARDSEMDLILCPTVHAIFHCPRCQLLWEICERLPMECSESTQTIKGKNMSITVEDAFLLMDVLYGSNKFVTTELRNAVPLLRKKASCIEKTLICKSISKPKLISAQALQNRRKEQSAMAVEEAMRMRNSFMIDVIRSKMPAFGNEANRRIDELEGAVRTVGMKGADGSFYPGFFARPAPQDESVDSEETDDCDRSRGDVLRDFEFVPNGKFDRDRRFYPDATTNLIEPEQFPSLHEVALRQLLSKTKLGEKATRARDERHASPASRFRFSLQEGNDVDLNRIFKSGIWCMDEDHQYLFAGVYDHDHRFIASYCITNSGAFLSGCTSENGVFTPFTKYPVRGHKLIDTEFKRTVSRLKGLTHKGLEKFPTFPSSLEITERENWRCFKNKCFVQDPSLITFPTFEAAYAGNHSLNIYVGGENGPDKLLYLYGRYSGEDFSPGGFPLSFSEHFCVLPVYEPGTNALEEFGRKFGIYFHEPNAQVTSHTLPFSMDSDVTSRRKHSSTEAGADGFETATFKRKKALMEGSISDYYRKSASDPLFRSEADSEKDFGRIDRFRSQKKARREYGNRHREIESSSESSSLLNEAGEKSPSHRSTSPRKPLINMRQKRFRRRLSASSDDYGDVDTNFEKDENSKQESKYGMHGKKNAAIQQREPSKNKKDTEGSKRARNATADVEESPWFSAQKPKIREKYSLPDDDSNESWKTAKKLLGRDGLNTQQQSDEEPGNNAAVKVDENKPSGRTKDTTLLNLRGKSEGEMMKQRSKRPMLNRMERETNVRVSRLAQLIKPPSGEQVKSTASLKSTLMKKLSATDRKQEKDAVSGEGGKFSHFGSLGIGGTGFNYGASAFAPKKKETLPQPFKETRQNTRNQIKKSLVRNPDAPVTVLAKEMPPDPPIYKDQDEPSESADLLNNKSRKRTSAELRLKLRMVGSFKGCQDAEEAHQDQSGLNEGGPRNLEDIKKWLNEKTQDRKSTFQSEFLPSINDLSALNVTQSFRFSYFTMPEHVRNFNKQVKQGLIKLPSIREKSSKGDPRLDRESNQQQKEAVFLT